MRAIGYALVGLGTIMIVAGLLVVVNDEDGTSTPRAAAQPESVATTTAAPTTTVTIVPTTAPVASESPESFFAAHTEAARTRDAAYLFARLDPRMFERYDEAACRAYMAGFGGPTYRAEVVAVGETGPWVWETDGLAREVDPAITVRVRRAPDGVNFAESDAHVVVGADGLIRWFSDCGTPTEGAR